MAEHIGTADIRRIGMVGVVALVGWRTWRNRQRAKRDAAAHQYPAYRPFQN